MKIQALDHSLVNVDWKQVIFQGCAPSGSLFFFDQISPLPRSFLEQVGEYSIQKIAKIVIPHLFKGALPPERLEVIATTAVSFPAPLVKLSDDISVLELFHGPSLAFKDFGARVLAEIMSALRTPEDPPVTILSATSGDTGGAVAQAFYKKQGFRVVVLYPANRVSAIQERQFATLGDNVIALKINGSFDNCQALVKRAFVDQDLRNKVHISSANSINLGRLLPQACYYIAGYGSFIRTNTLSFGTPLHTSVPSGNFGNIVAALITKRLGVPLGKLIAATNSNRTFTDYIQSGQFSPRSSIRTLSNAMDVGNPNNFPRLLALCDNNYSRVKEEFAAFSYSDQETEASMKELMESFDYICDPHGAIGYRALKEFLNQFSKQNNDSKSRHQKQYGMFLHTAHPGKFAESVSQIVKDKLVIPESLKAHDKQKILAIDFENNYEDFRKLLLS
jgi:threonine synthase